MNERLDRPEQLPTEPQKSDLTESLGATGDVRRNLFRKGAVVAGVTLSSRPVLAWHCKTTSAWGSELLNPATSLKNDTAHPRFADEGWYVRDWAVNSNTNGAMAGIGFPWNYLAVKFPAIVNSTTKTRGVFDYKKVTVSMLVDKLGVKKPIGVSSSSLAKDVFAYGASDFRAAILAAQLNYVLLYPLNDPFNHEKCVSLEQLKQMAEVNFVPSVGGAPWTQTQIKTYLRENWIIQ